MKFAEHDLLNVWNK